MNKFNNEKFNAIFEHYNTSINENQKALTKNVQGFQTKILDSCKVITDGELMIMGEDEKLDDYTSDNLFDFQQSYNSFQNPTKKSIKNKEIDYSRSDVKKNISKLKNNQVKSIINDKFKPLNQTYDKSFDVMQAEFLNDQMDNMRLENDKNKAYISKKSRIFQNKLPYTT